MSTVVMTPVSEARVVECEQSARFWSTHLNIYAETMRKKASFFTIASGMLGALTGLGVWATLEASTAMAAVIVVSAAGVATAALNIVPKTNRYGECAGAAATLAARYGEVLGELVDSLEMIRTSDAAAAARAQRAIQEFERAKRQKDSLQPFPDELQRTINELRVLQKRSPSDAV